MRTLPYSVPATTTSRGFSLPHVTRTSATAPFPRTTALSTTIPSAAVCEPTKNRKKTPGNAATQNGQTINQRGEERSEAKTRSDQSIAKNANKSMAYDEECNDNVLSKLRATKWYASLIKVDVTTASFPTFRTNMLRWSPLGTAKYYWSSLATAGKRCLPLDTAPYRMLPSAAAGLQLVTAGCRWVTARYCWLHWLV